VLAQYRFQRRASVGLNLQLWGLYPIKNLDVSPATRLLGHNNMLFLLASHYNKKIKNKLFLNFIEANAPNCICMVCVCFFASSGANALTYPPPPYIRPCSHLNMEIDIYIPGERLSASQERI
jgi:hypothetical protein